MKKEFYIGQPLIDKNTRERVIFVYVDRDCYNVLKKDGDEYYDEYYEYEDLEPSSEFKFSEIMAGLEHGYFEVGTKFRMPSTSRVITVEQGIDGLYLEQLSGLPLLKPTYINSTWILVGESKEMTLEEIEAELGYTVKLT